MYDIQRDMFLIFLLGYDPFRVVFDNLCQSAHVIDEVCHGYVCLRPHYSDTSENQPPHALLHVSEDVLHSAANFISEFQFILSCGFIFYFLVWGL